MYFSDRGRNLHLFDGVFDGVTGIKDAVDTVG
jgi:hypothetical protein